MKNKITSLISLLLVCMSFTAFADEKTKINQLLNSFLANDINDTYKNHDRFWADDLIYTGSGGDRINKTIIMNEIKDGLANNEGEDLKKTMPKYWAEDTDIRLYGETAIVAFRLMAESPNNDNEIVKSSYFNTGTFIKRDGRWQVVAWQATKIPLN